MKTPVWPLIIALIFLFNFSSAQPSGKSIKLYGHGYSLAVNKNKQLAIATNNGEVAFASSANGVWRKSVIEAKPDGKPGDKAIIKNTCYFNTDTGFVWGHMMGYNGQNDKIYRTVNRGKSWQPVKLGLEGVVTDAVYLDNGEAWLNVEEKGIAYTKDYSLTWTRLTVPYPFLARRMLYRKIFFNNKKAGIIGSPWNVLAYTSDNCKNWSIITTPYSQEYAKNKHYFMPSEINRVGIFNDYLLVRQGNSVFYSKVDTINWLLLAEYKDFYTDGENKALFFELSNGGFVKCDSSLIPVISFESIRNPYSAVCKNGCLYVLGGGKLWQVNTRNQLVESNINFIDARNPVRLGYGMAHVGNKIYSAKTGEWLYTCTLPFATDGGSLCMKDYETILFSRGDSVFYYHIANGKVDKGNGRATISQFVEAGIQRIIFTKGSASCWKNHEGRVYYERDNNKFVSSYGTDSDSMLPDHPATIDLRTVEEFVKKLPVIYTKQLSIDELGFTQEEYDSCKRNILKYESLCQGEPEQGEYPFRFDISPDFKRLIALVDSVKTMNCNLLNGYFYSQGIISTFQHWTKITFVNNKGEELEIKSELYSNGLYFPWHVKLHDLHSISTAIEINRFLKDAFPGFLYYGKRNIKFPGYGSRRIDAIQELVKLLYLNDE